ncbi:hypothetical protein ACFU7Y_29310 [Kitasatospora sp. NPDC057542]
MTDFTSERFDHVRLDIPAGPEDGCRAFRSGVLGTAEPPKPPVP